MVAIARGYTRDGGVKRSARGHARGAYGVMESPHARAGERMRDERARVRTARRFSAASRSAR